MYSNCVSNVFKKKNVTPLTDPDLIIQVCYGAQEKNHCRLSTPHLQSSSRPPTICPIHCIFSAFLVLGHSSHHYFGPIPLILLFDKCFNWQPHWDHQPSLSCLSVLSTTPAEKDPSQISSEVWNPLFIWPSHTKETDTVRYYILQLKCNGGLQRTEILSVLLRFSHSFTHSSFNKY